MGLSLAKADKDVGCEGARGRVGRVVRVERVLLRRRVSWTWWVGGEEGENIPLCCLEEGG